MDIYQYIKNDHKKVSDLFLKIISEKNSGKRERLSKEVMEEITLHAESEHNTFYKELKKHSESKQEAKHGDKEHAEIKEAMMKLDKMPAKGNEWLVQLGELKRAVEHHIKEEENMMFKAAKKVLDKEMTKKLVEKMENYKQKMME